MNKQLKLIQSLRERFLFWKTTRLLKQGEDEEVINILEKELETTQSKCRIFLYMARIYTWNSQPTKVLEIAKNISEQRDGKNDCTNAMWDIVLLLYELGEFEAALPYIQICTNLWPDNPHVFALHGLIQLELKNYSEAEIEFFRALKLDETNSDARYGVSELYLATGRNHLIQEFLEEYLAIAPNSPTSQVFMAEFLHYSRGDFKSALPYYERGMTLAQDSGYLRTSKQNITTKNYPHEIYSGYIDALLSCGLDDVANNFISDQFAGSTYHAWNSYLLWKTGDLDKAIVTAEKTLDTMPDNISLRIDLGCMYSQKGEFTLAESQFRYALNIKHTKVSVDYLAKFMVILYELEQFEEIEQIQEEALKIDDAQMWYVLASAYGDVNNWKMALEAAKNALVLIPDWLQVQLEFARANAHLDQPEDAIETYLSILQWQPENGKIWLELAQVYYNINDREKALDAVLHSLRTQNLSTILKTTAINLKDDLES